MNNLNIILPEIFLSLSIFSILMIGVFVKESYNLVTRDEFQELKEMNIKAREENDRLLRKIIELEKKIK